jgi:hypothetical protein
VTLSSENIIHEYHILYSSIYFVYNFLQNDVNLTLAASVNVDTIAKAERSWECHTMFITLPVRSTVSLNDTQLSRTLSFIETFKEASFTSVVTMTDERLDRVRSYVCKDIEDLTSRKRRRRTTYGLRYVLKMVEYFSVFDDNFTSYCQNLFVESKERLSQKYIGVHTTKLDCRQPNVTITEGHVAITPQYVYIMITVLSIVALCVVIFGLYQIFSLNRNSDSRN